MATFEDVLMALPSLMESNINDDIDYIPEDNPKAYCEEIIYEIEYARTPGGAGVFSKEELDHLEFTIKQYINL